MKAISIRQPFAACIIDGTKRVENRTRSLGLKAGQWYLLHASQAFYFKVKYWAEAWEGLRHLWVDVPRQRSDYPVGVIVGAFLAGETDAMNRSMAGNPWANGPVCTMIEAVVKFPAPIKASGSLGLWNPTFEALAHVVDQVHDAALNHLTSRQLDGLLDAVGLPRYAVCCSHCESPYWGQDKVLGCRGCGYGTEDEVASRGMNDFMGM